MTEKLISHTDQFQQGYDKGFQDAHDKVYLQGYQNGYERGINKVLEMLDKKIVEITEEI